MGLKLRCARGIENCANLGFDELATTMTLHSKNIDELDDTVSLAESLEVTRFYLNRFISAGRGLETIYLDVTSKEKIKAMETLYNKFYQSVRNVFGM